MSNRIKNPYNYTAEEIAIISRYFSIHNHWTKTIFNTIKQNVISHLRIQQNNLCCYCKYKLGFDIRQVEIEHIIPKAEYPIFTFEPLNLALSCPACNTKKNTKPVLYNAIVNYPTEGTNFKIIHAHYDDYSNHIDIIQNCLFVAKTIKGSETISFCELFRLSTVEERAKAYQNVGPNVLEQLVGELTNPDTQNKQQLIDIIKNAIK